ncbi:hypothetical protein ACFX2G_034894 [Malus domestica]
MNSESCFMYPGQFLQKPRLKARRRIPISSSLSMFLARSAAEQAIVSKRQGREGNQLVTDEVASGDVRDADEVAGAGGVAMEVVDLLGTMAKRTQVVHVSMVVVGCFDGAATGLCQSGRGVKATNSSRMRSLVAM